jgi:hypothetical protein
MEISQAQRRDTFDRLAAMYREINTVSDLMKVADEHRAAAKRHLEAAGLANGLPMMIPGQPLVLFVGGSWDGYQTNLPERIVKSGAYSTPLRESMTFRPTLAGEQLMQDYPPHGTDLETYEPAVMMMQRSEVISAIMVRAGFAANFKRRACSPAFNSEVAALLKLIAISLGTSDIRYISASLAHYRKSVDRHPVGECCVIQIERGS